MKNGMKVKSGICYFSSVLNLIREVASMSSEKVKVGILKLYVIVLVIAFLIPTIFFTWSLSVVPDKGGWDTGTACWDALGPSMKFMRSSLVTLPFLPVPGTWLISMPCFFAWCLTAGVERALDDTGPDIGMEAAAAAGATGAATGSSFFSCAGAVSTDYPSSTSISRRECPTGHTSSI